MEKGHAGEDPLPLDNLYEVLEREHVQIIRGLYVGSPYHAFFKKTWYQYGPELPGNKRICSFLNCGMILNRYENENTGDHDSRAKYYQLDLTAIGDSTDNLVLVEKISKACYWIDSELKQFRPVLAHGNSDVCPKVGLVIAAYLARTLNLDSGSAARAVWMIRPQSGVNETCMNKFGEVVKLIRSTTGSFSNFLPQPVLAEFAATPIVGNVWLGNLAAATELGEECFQYTSTVNANTVSSGDVYHGLASCAHTHKIQMTDEGANPGETAFELTWNETLSFMQNQESKGCRLLVYSPFANEAAIVVIGYLIATRRMRYEEAIEFVRNRRPNVQLKTVFLDALRRLSERHLSQVAAEVADHAVIDTTVQSNGPIERRLGNTFFDRYPLQPPKTSHELAQDKPLQQPDQLLCLTNGPTQSTIDQAEMERRVAQLGDVLPVSAEMRRDALVRHSGDVERAASYLFAWLESGGCDPTSGGAASSSDCGLFPNVPSCSTMDHGPSQGPGSEQTVDAPTVFGAWRSASKEVVNISGDKCSRRGLDQDSLAAACPKAAKLVESFVGQDCHEHECVLCGSARPRYHLSVEAHQDLGWVHHSCLTDALVP